MRAAWISVVVGIVILACKVGAWLLTGSTAVLSDALESIVHVLATVIMLVSLRISLTPPDPEHPYGHGRATGFSVGLEGGLVALSGVLVYGAIIERLWNQQTVEDLGWGLAGIGAATVINGLLGFWLLYIGNKHRSPALVADGQHVLADMWTSVGVLVGLGLVVLTGLQWIDLLVAALVGIHLIVVGFKLVREGIDTLMGSVPTKERQTVVDVLNEEREAAWNDVHQLRIQRVGELIHVDFHLAVPGDWTVSRVHELNERLERLILDRLDHDGSVIIHLDIAGESNHVVPPDEVFTLDGCERALYPGRHRARIITDH